MVLYKDLLYNSIRKKSCSINKTLVETQEEPPCQKPRKSTK